MAKPMTNSELVAVITKGASKMGEKDKSALSFVMDGNNEFSDTLNKEAAEKRKAAKMKAEADKKAKEEAKTKAIKDSLSADQFLLTDMTEGRLPKSGINHVMFRYPEGTWSADMEEDIPEVNEFYYWDADILEAMWLGYIMDEKVLAVGPPGTGKTSAGNQLAAWIRQPYARFNGKDGIDPSSFLGSVWATSQGMEWKDGLMTQAVQHGYFCAIDEIFKIPPGIQMAMQSLYEKGGFLMLDDKPGTIKDKHVHPHKNFRILGTDNTKGTGDDLDKYSAGQMQDISSLDRFPLTIELGYLKPRQEQEVLERMFPTLDNNVIKRSVGMANLVREAFVAKGDLSLTMSLRGLSVICELVARGLSLETAITLNYVNKLGDDSEVRTAKAFIRDAI